MQSKKVITQVRRENLGRQAERPIRIAGKLRSNSPSGSFIPLEIVDLAAEITTTGTYVKSVLSITNSRTVHYRYISQET